MGFIWWTNRVMAANKKSFLFVNMNRPALHWSYVIKHSKGTCHLPAGRMGSRYVSVALSFSHPHLQPSPIPSAPLSGLEDYSPQISVNHIYAHPLVNPGPRCTDPVRTYGAAATDPLLSNTVPQNPFLPLPSH